MNGIARKLMVVLLAVMMILGMTTTSVSAKGGSGRRPWPNPTPEPTFEPLPESEEKSVIEEEETEETVVEEEIIATEEEVSEEEIPAEEVVEEEEVDLDYDRDFAGLQFGNPISVNADGDVPPAPAHGKKLIDNKDGTYTIALSVDGQASSGTSSEVAKANVVLILDTSSSMNYDARSSNHVYYTVPYVPGDPEDEGSSWMGGNTYPHYYRQTNNGYSELTYRNNGWYYQQGGSWVQYTGTFYARSRIWAEKHALTDSGGIIDSLLAQNVAGDSQKHDIIEVALVDFSETGHQIQDFSTDANTLKSKINGITTDAGTNWEGALAAAQNYVTAIKASQPDEPVYVLFLTDGEPTRDDDHGSSQVASNDAWDSAKDDARGLVGTNNENIFYALFTWGDSQYAHYLSSLVQYAYTGTGNYNSELAADYQKYYTNADSTEALIEALEQIVHDITTNVGYTNVEMTDGVTAMTSASVKASAGGEVTGLKYYRGGGDYGAVDIDNGVYGTEWTDAPKAKINAKGEVDWDLGDLILEDGVKYTVTFTVWPKQEALDLVADLNNGVIKYEDLTAAQKAQIYVSGSHYTLKTNTDYPTITYSTVTTTQVDDEEPVTVISDPVTENMTNPEPVGLSEGRINAVKLWEDSLDPSQREEIEDVLLYLLVGNEYYYKDASGNPLGVTLTEESNWTETDYIAIAPGLMVTEDSPAYDPDALQVTWGGKTYALLEEGHEYVFEESQINHHYELTAYVHHPMIMGTTADGQPDVKDVTFIKDASGNITGIEKVVAMGDNISATNILKSGINVQKQVVDDNGEVFDTNDPFTVKIIVTDENGNALPDKLNANDETFTLDYRIYYGEKNPEYESHIVRNPDGTIKYSRTDHIYTTGTEIEETIYEGDVIRVVNVEKAGYFCVVEENVESPYVFDSVDYLIHYGSEADAPYADEDAKTINGNVCYPVKSNSACTATVINKLTGNFYIYHSSVAGDGDLETIPMSALNADLTYDLHAKTKPGTLYGGYYLDYAGKGDYKDDGVKGTTGVAYNGWNYAWSNPETLIGTAMKPVKDETYYIKEVPTYYLRNYYQINYMKNTGDLKALYLISAVDDLNYNETGVILQETDSQKATKVLTSFTFRNMATGKSVTLKANTVFRTIGLKEQGYLTYYNATKNTTYFKANTSYTVLPYWVTPDGITEDGISTRTITIKDLTKAGISKSDN